MIVYLDTSVILRHLLNQVGVYDAWGDWKKAYCSELVGLEARRTIDRLRLSNDLDDEGVATAHRELARNEAGFGILALNRAVVRRAALPLPTSVKTLDALHLATATLFREQREEHLIFVTHDAKLGTAASALGFAIGGVSLP